MKNDLSEKAAKLTAWIIFLSIIGLTLISIFPLISVEETSLVEEELYFNLEMMEKSYNDNIVSLSGKINIINTSFFLVLIFGILSNIGLTIYRSQKYPSFAQLIIIVGGCSIIILSFLIIFLHIIFITTVGELEGISTSNIIPQLKFVYIPLTVCVVLLIGSVSYTWIVASYFIKYHKEDIKPKQENNFKLEKTLKKTSEKAKDSLTKTKPLLQEGIDIRKKSVKNQTYKYEEVEDWLKDELQNLEKTTITDKEEIHSSSEKNHVEKMLIQEEKPRIETEKTENIPIKLEEAESTIVEKEIPENPSQEEEKEIPSSKKLQPESFKLKEEKDETGESENLFISKSFEKALSSAINKKQIERKLEAENKKIEGINSAESYEQYKQEETENSGEIFNIPDIKIEESNSYGQEPEKKRLRVRCPNCENVFIVEKTGDATKIRCPRCGKDGFI